MRGGRGEGLDKDLEAFPPRGAVPAPHRLALHWASLVRSCSSGGCGTCSWPGTAELPGCLGTCRAPLSNQHHLQLQPEQPPAPKASALEIKTRDYKRHHGTGTIVDELAKRASSDQKWSLPWEGDHPNEERQGTWHPCIPPNISSQQGRISWTPALGRYLAAPNSPTHRVSGWGKKS